MIKRQLQNSSNHNQPIVYCLIVFVLLTGCHINKSALPQSEQKTDATLENPQHRDDILPEPESLNYSATRISKILTPTAKPVERRVTSEVILSVTPFPTLLPTNSPTSTPTSNPYVELTIDALANRNYGGGELDIVDTMETNDSFTRYRITYPSDGLEIAGFMNVPNDGNRFPVALVLHGYVNPSQYDTLAYTSRYADALAEAGYFVIHPNLRNYPPSDQGSNAFRVGYAVDVLNLIAIIRQQSQDPTGYLRRANSDDINLWGHSMGGGVVLRVITVNSDDYIRAAVLYGSMSGDERLNFNRIRQWSNGREGDFELAASEEMIKAISPLYHLKRITAPISIHHSADDDVVPPQWSDDLWQRLSTIDHPAECFSYVGQPHTFRGQGEDLFMRRVIEFFSRY